MRRSTVYEQELGHLEAAGQHAAGCRRSERGSPRIASAAASAAPAPDSAVPKVAVGADPQRRGEVDHQHGQRAERGGQHRRQAPA